MTTITKQPNETHLITFDFSKKMGSTETISSVNSNVSDPGGITFGSPIINAQNVNILISGGVAPSRYDVDTAPYKLTMIVTTDIGQILEEDITLNIQEI
jgi:hypothetical protein